MYQFELQERGGGGGKGKPVRGELLHHGRTTRRRALENSSDDQQQQDSKRAKLARQVSKETEVKECEEEEELRASSVSDLPDSAQSNDNKSEISDQDSTQVRRFVFRFDAISP